MITVDDVVAARARIAPYTRQTPVMRATAMRQPLPVSAEVTLKLELFQITGSFKARGAMNRYLAARDSIPPAGIVTASGGNHGLAVARTAHAAAARATIFVPSNVRPEKVEKMRSWNADVRIVGDEWSVSNDAANAFAAETGAAYFHPFADPLVVAGQGTLGIEIVEQIADMDVVVVAIGGGGLVSGMATAIKAMRPDVRIIGVEPQGSPTLAASLSAGRKVRLDAVTSRVATMSCRETDERIFRIVQKHVDEIVLVSDDEMLKASRWLWAEFAIAADLSGAASIAALCRWPDRFQGAHRICALVCGAGPDGIPPIPPG
jgi:threonine dehydratase